MNAHFGGGGGNCDAETDTLHKHYTPYYLFRMRNNK